MFKFLSVLALGIAMGYAYGFKDAQVNEKHAAQRFVDVISGEEEGPRAEADAVSRSVTRK